MAKIRAEVQFEMVMQTGEPQRNAIPNVPLRFDPAPPLAELAD